MPTSRHIFKRKRQGQTLIETLTGFMILIPLGLLSYDLTYILIAIQNNELLADNAARAAASHADPVTAQDSVQKAIDDFQQNSHYGKVALTEFIYNNENNGQIALTTQMTINIPVVFGPWSTITVNAQSIQPIVGVPAPR